MQTTKNIPFNKTHVLVEKETFEIMNNVIKETKKAIEWIYVKFLDMKKFSILKFKPLLS